MKKQMHVFFTSSDERTFDAAIRAVVPDLKVVDGELWKSTEPPLTYSIADCKENTIYLWSPSVARSLPSKRHPDGVHYQGPQAGVVIQFMRSRLKDERLCSGNLSTGFNEPNPAMTKFTAAVWKALNNISSSALISVDPITRETFAAKPAMFRAGADAIAWCTASSTRAFTSGGPFLLVPCNGLALQNIQADRAKSARSA